MAKLEDRGRRGLPPAPAPTRRGANPWRLSDTARKRETPPVRAEETAEKLLQELFDGKAQEEVPSAAPPPPTAAERRPPQSMWKSRRRSGFWPLLVLLLIAGVLVKLVSEARETGNWRELIPAVFAILFIAHAIWRSRQRRDGRGGDGEKS